MYQLLLLFFFSSNQILITLNKHTSKINKRHIYKQKLIFYNKYMKK